MSELPTWAGAEMIRMADEEFVASMEPLDLTEFKDAEIARLQHQWSESDKAWLAAKQEIARLSSALRRLRESIHRYEDHEVREVVVDVVNRALRGESD
jgi:hypothetical protein